MVGKTLGWLVGTGGERKKGARRWHSWRHDGPRACARRRCGEVRACVEPACGSYRGRGVENGAEKGGRGGPGAAGGCDRRAVGAGVGTRLVAHVGGATRGSDVWGSLRPVGPTVPGSRSGETSRQGGNATWLGAQARWSAARHAWRVPFTPV
jgi:hypothetical protein